MSENRNIDIWIAGACAAFTVDVIVYPLDTLKTRFQSPDYKRLYTNGAPDFAANRNLVRGVYQGIGSVILATLPSSGAFFTTYEGVKATLQDYNPTWGGDNDGSGGGGGGGKPLLPQPLIHALASGTAELVSCAILTPVEVIKQNAQMVDNSARNGPRVNATLQTLKRFRSNPFALWRGYTALAGRNLPATALQFPIFERIKEAVQRYRDERGIRTHSVVESGLITAFSAGTGGSIAAVVTTPIDVVKTRIMLAAAEEAAQEQSSGSSSSARGGKDALIDATGRAVQNAKDSVKDAVKEPIKTITKHPGRKTSREIASEIIQEQGVKGLFRGGALRAVWTMAGAGLYLGAYESGRMYLAKRRERLADEEGVS